MYVSILGVRSTEAEETVAEEVENEEEKKAASEARNNFEFD